MNAFNRCLTGAVMAAAIAMTTLPAGATDTFLQSLYLHDDTLLQEYSSAHDTFDAARAATDGLWDTLLANHEAGMDASRRLTAESAKIRFEGILVAIDELPWSDVWKCGRGVCEDMPDLAALIDGIDKKDMAAITAIYPSGSTDTRLKGWLENAKTLANDIKVLAAKIKADPDGKKTLAELPAGPAAMPVTAAVARLNIIATELDNKTANLRSFLLDAIEQIDKVVDQADGVIEHAAFAPGVGSTQDVLAVLQRKDVLSALKDGPLKTAIAKGRAAKLPATFKASLLANVIGDDGQPLDVSTVGELIAFLTSEHSEIETVRLELLADSRKALAAMRGQRLAEKKAKLKQVKQMIEILTLQRQVEIGLERSEPRISQYPGYDEGSVVGTLETLHRAYQRAGGDKQAEVDRFGDVVLYLMQYSSRVGHLRDAEARLRLEMAGLDHRFSIERSKLNADARQAMISRGLDGLVTYAEGGITAEDIAGVIGFLQTGLLSAIAATN